MKKIAVLGSTGSIGRQALDVIKSLGYTVVGLSAHSNVDLLQQQIMQFQPPHVAITQPKAAEQLAKNLDALPVKPKCHTGAKAAVALVQECGADIVINSIVGIAGLGATLAALSGGVDVALANKESLVAGGSLVMQAQKASGAALLPVDSEHSAIFQCLQNIEDKRTLKKILLTASGGPFYGYTTSQLETVTKEHALRHPNWSMGSKISIDSATLMNKGLELIEAMWMFGLAEDAIEIVVQRQSVIHSMVEFCDNSVLAQLGVPDMRLPIQYALTWPKRLEGIAPKLDFSQLKNLDFGMADSGTFRCLAACRAAAQKGGLAACAANGANEEAVALFLQDKISFLDIGRLVEGCVQHDSYAGAYSLSDVYACDEAARQYVRSHK